jgi:hypothetical protein
LDSVYNYWNYKEEILSASRPLKTPLNYTLVDSAFASAQCASAPGAPNATDAFQAWFNFQKSKNNTNFNYTVGTPKTFWVQ